jgi:glutamyl-tRNA synthetase
MEDSKDLKDVRVRIAPSPTGFLHLGLARAALFNYIFAKKNNGEFILRLEDTDKERSKPEFEKDIIENLKWLGINWDFEPYRQSERISIYAKYLEKLLKEKKAYYCFCSQEELEATKQYQLSVGQPLHYNGKCRNLSETEVKEKLAAGKPSVIRFKTLTKKIIFRDLVRGKIEFDSSLLGDIIIAKDLTTPLYNFAAVVDDFEMKISHIIRGEDHIPNTPKQILIQEALGFPRPEYAHLPLVLGPDRTKLSKRHNACSVDEYRKQGYLVEALINFMAFLGWNPGTEREIFSLSSLINEFSLDKVQKGGAIFNIKRLDYLNGFYIRQKSLDKLTELCLPYLRADEKSTDFEVLKKIVGLYQERLKKLSEISEFTDFFFKEKLEYNKDLLKWKDMSEKDVKDILNKLEKILSGLNPKEFNKENLEKILIPEAEKIRAGNRGYLLWPLRVALSGKKASAGPFEIAEILGKQKTLNRINQAMKKYASN